jgi:predicted NBD/HSP70 family sugar kinase
VNDPQDFAPGSQAALRAHNRERIIEILEEQGTLTQAQLARVSGLSPATVSNIVKALVASGHAVRELTTSSGRRAHGISLTASRDIAVGVDIGRRHIRLIAATKQREVLAERFVQLPVGHAAERTIAAAVVEYEALLAETDRTREDVIGVGVGIPGPIDQRTRTVIDGAILPEWVGLNIPELLERAFGRPVRVENDANLGALGEVTFGDHVAERNLVYVKVATGIGAGIVVDGALLSGAVGIAGEIGHVGLQTSDVICHCGNRGCLETVASTQTILGQLRQAGRTVTKSEDIVELALSGDVTTQRFLEDAGRAVGEACGHIANLLGPAVVVVGGPLAVLGEMFLGPIESSMRRHCVPLIRETVRLEPTSRGDQTEALGAVALVL